MVDREVDHLEFGMTRKSAVFGATKRLFKLAEVTAKYENNYMHACYQLSTKPRVGQATSPTTHCELEITPTIWNGRSRSRPP